MTLTEASLGKTSVDILVTNVQLANVLTGEIYPADTAVYGAQIVAVEPPGTQPQRQASRVLDGNDQLVAPGLIETEMVAKMDEKAKQISLNEIVLGRLGQPEEVANVVAFLASDLSRHITGQVINVDGGQLM